MSESDQRAARFNAYLDLQACADRLEAAGLSDDADFVRDAMDPVWHGLDDDQHKALDAHPDGRTAHARRVHAAVRAVEDAYESAVREGRRQNALRCALGDVRGARRCVDWEDEEPSR